jgi:pyruvate dehydrogenase E1 component alpha subunit
MFDPELYRDKAEVEQWRERDPIRSFTEQCLLDGTLSEGDLHDIESSADAEIAAAVAFAEAGTWEDAEDLERDVLTPADMYEAIGQTTREPVQ